MKQTKKYASAKKLIDFPHSTQEELYGELNKRGYWWNSKIKEWELSDEPPNPPNDLIKVRVWAGSKKVEEIADKLTQEGVLDGLTLVDRSKPYPCRPPHQSESRIYLTFREIEDQSPPVYRVYTMAWHECSS